MSEPGLERVRISATTVVTWIAAILSVAGMMAWGALSNRLEKLETGTSIPMAETTRQQFRVIEVYRSRLEQQFDRHDERLDALEQRVRALEAERKAAFATLRPER